MTYRIALALAACLLCSCTESEVQRFDTEPAISTVRPCDECGSVPAFTPPHVVVTKMYSLALEVQYDDPNIIPHTESYNGCIGWVVTLEDMCESWLTNDHLTDLNNDGIVNFIDFAEFARSRK